MGRLDVSSLPPIELRPHVPRGFSRLSRRERDGGSPGGALGLGLLLGVLGFGTLWLFFSGRADEGEESMWVVPVVGFAFAVVSLVLLFAGLRGWRGRSIPSAEVSIEKGVAIRPGARFVVRIRQPGPARIEKLTVKAVCERQYRRRVDNDESRTVEEIDPIWESTLLEISDQAIASGAAVERDLELRLPADAPPTGRAQPEGQIRWAIEVWGEAGLLRATHHSFALLVQGRGDGAE